MTTEQQIKKTLEELVDAKRKEERIVSIESQLVGTKKEIKRYVKIVEKELRDIKNVEGMGMRGLFHSILGNKEQQIKKERQEYLKATLKYKELLDTENLLEYEIKVLVKNQQPLHIIENKLESLKKVRIREILSSKTPESERLKKIFHSKDQLTRELKEYAEAEREGEVAISYLKKMFERLNAALNWNSDAMMRDSSIYKQRVETRYIVSKARDYAIEANISLKRFERELLDVNMDLHMDDLEKLDVSQFMNIFYNNLISDWILHSKIKKTSISVRNTIEQMDYVMNQIRSNKDLITEELQKLEKQKDNIILGK